MSAIAEKNRKFANTSSYDTCFVCKEENAYMYASVVKNAKQVSLCSVKCFTTYNELVGCISQNLPKASK